MSEFYSQPIEQISELQKQSIISEIERKIEEISVEHGYGVIGLFIEDSIANITIRQFAMRFAIVIFLSEKLRNIYNFKNNQNIENLANEIYITAMTNLNKRI